MVFKYIIQQYIHYYITSKLYNFTSAKSFSRLQVLCVTGQNVNIIITKNTHAKTISQKRVAYIKLFYQSRIFVFSFLNLNFNYLIFIFLLFSRFDGENTLLSNWRIVPRTDRPTRCFPKAPCKTVSPVLLVRSSFDLLRDQKCYGLHIFLYFKDILTTKNPQSQWP